MDALGGECVFASEIDKFAAQSYKALYNGAQELHGDITAIAAADIPDHDILVGGFPCQAFSVAGQRKGFEDTRGTLFFEIARIAAEKKPRLLLLENVKGLLSHDKGRTFDVMCAALNDIGYAIDFRVLNSKNFSVPQNRERIFIVASRDAAYEPWNIGKGNDVVTKAKRRAAEAGVRTFNFDWPEISTVTSRLRDVLEPNVDEKYYLSEEKTAKLLAQLNERIDYTEPIVYGSLEHYGNDQMSRIYSVNGVAPTITVVSGGGREQKIAEPQEVNEGCGLSYALTASYGHKTQLTEKTLGKKRLTYVGEPQIEKVGQIPSDSGQTGGVYGTDGIAPTCLNQHGNAVTKVVVVGNTNPSGRGMNGSVYDSNGLSPTLTTNKGEGVKVTEFSDGSGIAYCVQATYAKGTSPGDVGKGRRTHVIERSLYRIRKLTPLECWRLQGFSDSSHETVKAAGVSDSQRYKQAGNAVTVSVIAAIGKPLIAMLNEKMTKDDEREAAL